MIGRDEIRVVVLDALAEVCDGTYQNVPGDPARDTRQWSLELQPGVLGAIDPVGAFADELTDRIQRLAGAPALAESVAPAAAPSLLYVQWSDPFGDGPVVGVLRMDDVARAQVAQRSAAVRAAGMVEAVYSAEAFNAYFVDGFRDGDSSYAEVFAATTALPCELFERMETDYEQRGMPQGRWVEGVDTEAVLKRLESVKDMGFTERTSWGAAEVFAADAIVVKAHGAAFARYGHVDDNGQINNFTVDIPFAIDVPTLDLSAGDALVLAEESGMHP